MLGLHRLHPDKLEEWRRLLAGAGIRFDPFLYLAMRRLLAGGLLLSAFTAWGLGWVMDDLQPVVNRWSMLAGAIALLVMMVDKIVLGVIKKRRQERIVEQLYALTHQLLYYADSRMNLHGKLVRCAPHAGVIRKEWQMMLNEWYHDPAEAIERFRIRVGTDEAAGFAETLQSIRQYDHGDYYDLLRLRLQDFKEQMELVRDSRKESVSYVLFVLAGIPILYMFRIFLHPWVKEGQQLFQSLQ